MPLDEALAKVCTQNLEAGKNRTGSKTCLTVLSMDFMIHTPHHRWGSRGLEKLSHLGSNCGSASCLVSGLRNAAPHRGFSIGLLREKVDMPRKARSPGPIILWHSYFPWNGALCQERSGAARLFAGEIFHFGRGTACRRKRGGEKDPVKRRFLDYC